MFKTKLRVVFMFFVFVIACGLVANHLTGRVFNFYDPIGEAKRIYKSLSTQNLEPSITKTAINKSAIKVQGNKTSTDFHFPQADITRCVDTSLGEVKYERNGDIYTWTDSQGVVHFTDEKPNFAVATYDSGFKAPLDYFDLTLNTPKLPSSFNQALRIKLNTVFKVYGQIIGVHALKKVKLNLTVLPTRGSYEVAIKQRGGDPRNSVGMYFHASNSAFIEYRNTQNAMSTAVHEAVHAINKAVLGYTPRWLNEGFAEYFEITKNHMQTGIVEPNTSWTINNKLAKGVFNISRLIGSEESWKQNNTSKLYASSWATIYFLMDSSQGRILLKNIMLAEQESPCNKLQPKQLKNMLHSQFPNFSKVYAQWLKTPFKAHNF